MNRHARNGIFAGLVAGIIAAVLNWDGKPIVAASAILFGALIGWLIGAYISKRNTL
ncbi:hypothetical protein ACFSAG_08370 [Sphingorhabdus buctiana]|uniref:Glycine zipper family protein n=1 Tax=Sphingorhabdus buctiana TaxID=1508805 RepID=A0ABW4MEV1_9SPHN